MLIAYHPHASKKIPEKKEQDVVSCFDYHHFVCIYAFFFLSSRDEEICS